jgi:hypothetical protein
MKHCLGGHKLKTNNNVGTAVKIMVERTGHRLGQVVKRAYLTTFSLHRDCAQSSFYRSCTDDIL